MAGKIVSKFSSRVHFLTLIFVMIVTVRLFGTGYFDSSTNHCNTGSTSKEFHPFNISFVEENLYSLDQMDPRLIEYTRIRHLTPPSKLPYNLTNVKPAPDPYFHWVREFFKNKANGTFIECGAYDGEVLSHTIHLERDLGWSGLVVECNPTVVPFLRAKNRKAWVADVCLSPFPHPTILNFSSPSKWPGGGRVGRPWNHPGTVDSGTWTMFNVQAIPFYTILAGLGWKEVDFFSFDIEEQELNVLKHFPFELFKFKLLIVEVHLYTKEELPQLDSLLRSKGYVFVKNFEIDKIYVHESYKNMIP